MDMVRQSILIHDREDQAIKDMAKSFKDNIGLARTLWRETTNTRNKLKVSNNRHSLTAKGCPYHNVLAWAPQSRKGGC